MVGDIVLQPLKFGCWRPEMYLVEVEDDLEGEPPAETNDVPECAHGSDDPLILVMGLLHGEV
ncbi:MAG TPA: hypothetical protein DHV14_04935, partial [Micrococcales bacterium]|nr:hypothetical protein [Micrococcales bacterium]